MSDAVRVLMLSWEYPPMVVGALGRHVEALARELARSGHDVQVVTRGDKAEIVDEVIDGVWVRRAALRAARLIRRDYTWTVVAAPTAELYSRVLGARREANPGCTPGESP